MLGVGRGTILFPNIGSPRKCKETGQFLGFLIYFLPKGTLHESRSNWSTSFKTEGQRIEFYSHWRKNEMDPLCLCPDSRNYYMLYLGPGICKSWMMNAGSPGFLGHKTKDLQKDWRIVKATTLIPNIKAKNSLKLTKQMSYISLWK